MWLAPGAIEAKSATVVVAVAVAEPDVAVIVAVPSATEVTRPVEDTIATDATDVAHVTPDIVLSLASFTVAVSVTVSPSEAKLTVVGDSVIEAAT